MTTTSAHTLVMKSPVGPLALTTADGISLASAHFVSDDILGAEALTQHVPGAAVTGESAPFLEEARRQFEGYFSGALRDFQLPLAARGTPFQQRVWAELRRIPYGTTASYGEVALRLGLPLGASRAVGTANGANPIAVVVPCHRVIGANGRLTGYAGGLDRKRFLLGLEAPPGLAESLFGWPTS